MRKSPSIWILIIFIWIGTWLSVVPLPESYHWLKPDWTGIFLVSFVLHSPLSVAMLAVFITGFIQDIILGLPIGPHLFGYLLTIGTLPRWKKQLLAKPMAQQSIQILFLLLISRIIVFWFYGASNDLPENVYYYWLSSLWTIILWPWSYVMMLQLTDISQKKLKS